MSLKSIYYPVPAQCQLLTEGQSGIEQNSLYASKNARWGPLTARSLLRKVGITGCHGWYGMVPISPRYDRAIALLQTN